VRKEQRDEHTVSNAHQTVHGALTRRQFAGAIFLDEIRERYHDFKSQDGGEQPD
jgi:hypothetical protein